MAQFGIAGKPEVAAAWQAKTIEDDEVVQSNERGYVSFATSGKDSRTTQMFINLVNNANLDDMGCVRVSHYLLSISVAAAFSRWFSVFLLHTVGSLHSPRS